MMKRNAMSALRANIVLFALSVALVAWPVVAYVMVTEEGDWMASRKVRIAIFVAAFFLSAFVKQRARLAYEQAIKQACVDSGLNANDILPIIDSHTRHAWLVQLHIETHPACVRCTAVFAR